MPGAESLRYTVQRAATPVRVPREACQTPTLRQKLKGFALKPLIRSISQKRSTRIRREIEQSQCINESKGLWSDADFAFVVEAKAKTIQLRQRTMEMLQKIDTCERAPTPPAKHEDATTSASGEATPQPQSCISDRPASPSSPRSPKETDRFSIDSLALPSSPPSRPLSARGVPGEASEDDKSMVNQRTTGRLKSIKAGIRSRISSVLVDHSNHDELLDLLSKQQVKPLDNGDKQRMLQAVLNEKVADVVDRARSRDGVERKTELKLPESQQLEMFRRSSAPPVPCHTLAHSIRGSMIAEDSTLKPVAEDDSESMISPEGVRKAMLKNVSSTTLHKDEKGQFDSNDSADKEEKGHHNANDSSAAKRRISRLNSIRQSVQHQHRRSKKSLARQSGITLFDEDQEMLYEDTREIRVIDAIDSYEMAHIWIFGDGLASDGIRIEVLLDNSQQEALGKKSLPHQVQSRVLSSKDVMQLFELGGMYDHHAQERFQYLCGLVCLESCRSQSEEALIDFNILLTGFDVQNYSDGAGASSDIDSSPRKKIVISSEKKDSVAPVKQDLMHCFEHYQSYLKEQSDIEREILARKESLDVVHHKQVEIKAVTQRFKLNESAAESLYDLFQKFDLSGDGKIDEREFENLLCGIMAASGKPAPDAAQMKCHWRDLRSYSDNIVYTQFIEYLVKAFPRVQTMTAFEVSRFSNRARASLCPPV